MVGAYLLRGESMSTGKTTVNYDGYFNVFSGAGMISRDPFAATRYKKRWGDWFAGLREADDLFTGNGLAQRIITIPAEDATRAGWEIDTHSADKNIEAKIEEKEAKRKIASLCEDLALTDNLSLALSWDRLFGGAAVLMLADDGGTLEDPLNEETLRRIECLEVFNPIDISYTGACLYDNPANPNYGKPQWYNIIGKWGNSFLVHESRLLLFNGQPITNYRRRMRNGWGGSIMEQVNESLTRLGSSFDFALMAVGRLSQSVLKFANLASKMQSDAGEAEVIRRLHVIDMGRHLLNTIAIDASEDYTQHQITVGGLKEVIEEMEIEVSAASGIPMTILFGRSPAGMNSTGKSDFESYYNMVTRIQERVLRPQLSRFIYLLSKCQDYEITLPESWEIEFEPLWNPSEKEEAETKKTQADARKADADAINTLINAQVLDIEEARATLAEHSGYLIDRSLDDALSRPPQEQEQ